MTQTVLNGGNKTQQDLYTGPKNELSVDESNRDLRLHDGATPGGHVLLNRDGADQRYQGYSAELAGLTAFEPQQRGLLARLGPAEYLLRSIEVNVDNLTIQQANGYEGNPKISLAPTIDSQHEWSEQQLFKAVCEFEAGINADVSGNLTGNVAGNVTGNLTGNAAGNHTGTFTGDVNLVGKTLQLDDAEIAVSKIAGLIEFIKLHGFPAGAITMWGGSVASIPAGWNLCDGLNGTPDLRSKFIVGAGSDYAVSAGGGASQVTPVITVTADGAHTHAVTGTANTASTGATFHYSTKSDTSGGGSGSTLAVPPDSNAGGTPPGITDPGHSHTLTGTAASGGSHTHAATSSQIDNRPPYYALCFIRKA